VTEQQQVPLLPDVLLASPLVLVRWSVDAVDEVLAAVESSFADLHRWMPWAAAMPMRQQQRTALAAGNAAFDAGTEFQYLFRETETGECVGAGGVSRRVGPGAVEIGYWVRSDRHGRGYATRASEAMTAAAFRFLPDVKQVQIHMDPANLASARVPEKLGYRLLRLEPRQRLAPGHTGRSHVWQQRRVEWTVRTRW
jgi:RimJ/RimL family protein N-acetyltransferase